MLFPDLTDVPIEVFGGYCPAIPPSDLPAGAASVAQDVMYPQGGVRVRGGLNNAFALGSPIPGNASINGLKSYLTPTLNKRLMAWDSLGNLYKENPQGTLNLVASRPYTNLFYQSSTLFGREYQAFWNSLGGFDIPRQYDDTNWDRVSQGGPGAAPAVVDDATSYAIVATPNGLMYHPQATGFISNLSEDGNGLCTMVLFYNVPALTAYSAYIPPMQVGDPLKIAGATVAGYNGTFKLLRVDATPAGSTGGGGAVVGIAYTFLNATLGLAIDNSATGTYSFPLMKVVTQVPHTFQVEQILVVYESGTNFEGTSTVRQVASNTVVYAIIPTFGLAAAGGGVAIIGGNIGLGRHNVSLAFITRQGFITPAAPPGFWNAGGSRRASLSGIAVGPANVVARILLFTPVIVAPATQGSFYSLPTGSSEITGSVMVINDNVTTTAIVDFSETILPAGFSANYLFSQLELGESSFVLPYSSRLCWLGERNHVSNVVNLGFEGGFGADGGGNVYPLGWTGSPGGFSAVALGFVSDWGDAYAIKGDGATANRGKITQSAYQDYLQVPIIQRNTSYSVRVRVARSGGLAQGTLHINLTSALGGFTTVGLQVTAAQAGIGYAEFIASLTDAPLVTPQTDLLLQIYADGTPTNGHYFLVDSVEIYPTNAPFNYSTARFSHSFNPESYDATTGQVQIRPSDGQQFRAGFPLRNNLYLAKDHYLGYVTDDGINEPASWAFNEVSNAVGICGPNAVDWTEEWAAFAERSGLYLCWGSDPVKITTDIQTDVSGAGKTSWASINWAFAHTIWVRIDRANKMILIGAPINGAQSPNVVFMVDYKWLASAEDIASTPLVTYSSFTGKMLAHGRGPRWSVWNITSNSMTFAERADGTVQPFFGNGSVNGKIYQQLDCSLQPSDDGVAVSAQYQTYGCPTHTEEQMYRFGAHRKLCGYLKFRAYGAGSLGLSIGTAQRTTVLRAYTLSTNPVGDGERPANVHGERFYITASSAQVGTWWQLEKLIPCMRKDASIVTRGASS